MGMKKEMTCEWHLKILAYVGVILVPIAVPLICKFDLYVFKRMAIIGHH